jgi:two-component system, sporulation sensor kinase E
MDHPHKNRTIIIISLIAIVLSIVVLLGWILNIPGFQAVLPAFEAMRFNTALCFVLSGGALLTTQYKTHKYPLLFYILSSLVTLFASVTLFQYIFHFNSGLDQLFVKDGRPVSQTYPFPGRMSVNSDICFLFLGVGFLILTVKTRVFNIAAQYLFHIVTILSSIAIIGYLYRASFFYELSSPGPMAVQSVVLFFFVSIGASLLHPSLGITNLFTGQLVGNKMARRLFILIICVVITLGTLRIKSQHYYQFSVELWVALITVCFLAICLLVIWNTATWLNGIDLKRYEAEEEIKAMNEELEEIVEERTIEFQKSEEKYRLLIEHASDAIYVVDIYGNFTDVNDSMCSMTGYSRDELLNLNVEAIVDPEELKVDPIKHGPRSEGESTVRERRFLRKNGSVFDAEISVKMFPDDKVLIMARDITDRKKMETGLKEAELKFRTLAERSMVGVYISQKERFIYINPRFAEIFGYETHELINTENSAIDIIISKEDQKAVRDNVEARYRGEVDNVHYEVKGKKKDGTSNWVEFYGSSVIIGDEPTIIGSMLDITERKRAEALILREKTLSDTIINSLPGVFYLRKDQGQYLR